MTATQAIHPTAVIDGDVQLDDDVEIGPHCLISGAVTIRSGTRLLGQNWVQGRAVIGHHNRLYPGARIGGPPQDLGFDHEQEQPGIEIGDENVFREGFTAHRGKSDEPTRIGHRNYFMTNTHVGHDCQVGNDCQMATGAALGGHVILGDRAIMGGNSAVHQFVTVGPGAIIGGGRGASQDVPPWFMVTAINICGSLNLIGMRRSGMSPAEIMARKWVYRTLYRRKLSLTNAVAALELRGDDPVVREYIDFIQATDRPICHGVARPSRGGAV
jgi:UDP-N-acetylglucosamine acyltransferase